MSKGKKILVTCVVLGVVMLNLGIYLIVAQPFAQTTINYKHLVKTIKNVKDTKNITADELIPFEWDNAYSFAPNTETDTMRAISGVAAGLDIDPTHKEGMVNIIFVKNKKMVCSIQGYPEEIGFTMDFGPMTGSFNRIQSKDKPSFEIAKEKGIQKIICNSDI